MKKTQIYRPSPADYNVPSWLLLGRVRLSLCAFKVYLVMHNGLEDNMERKFVDADGSVYGIYPIKELAGLLGYKDTQVLSAFKQLQDCGLIRRVRQGQGKPSKTYCLTPAKDEVIT